MTDTAARELIAWWRGVAADEAEGAQRWRAVHNAGRAAEAGARALVWTRCAQQLELVLVGKPFNPDL